MPLPLILSILFIQAAVQTPALAPAQTGAPNFQAPMTIAEPVRLAMTPTLDGSIDEEEWDPLVSAPDLKGYFEWEPGKLHFAGVVPNGDDLLVSIDLKSNGWLVGADNLEFRVTNTDSGAKLTARLLDATQVSGPRWVDVPGIVMDSQAVAKSDGTNTTYEMTLGDAGHGFFPTEANSKLSVRMDAIPTTTTTIDPFLPRALAPVQLMYARAAALPMGLRWNTEGAGNVVVPGESLKVRFTFNGDDKMQLRRLALRSEGPAHSALAESAFPFPGFDNKGRSFADYKTEVPSDSTLGYRIVRGTLTDKDGVPAMLQASYRIAPLIDFDLVRIPIHSKSQPQVIRLAYHVKSNSSHRVDGNVVLTPPSDYQVVSGNDQAFTISAPYAYVRRSLQLQIPAAAKGVVTLTFKVQVAGKVMNMPAYINIE